MNHGVTEESHTLWCASYPKSGNTWVRAILRTLLQGGSPDINDLGARGSTAAHSLDVLGVREANLSPEHVRQVRRTAWASERDDSSRFIPRKTHDAWLPAEDGFPSCWQPVGARCLYIVRDPRDVAVSWAHHLDVSHKDAVEIMADPNFSAFDDVSALIPYRTGTWSEHVQSWTYACDLPVLTVRYEDLGATESVMAMATWIDADITQEEAQRVVAECAFTQLAAAEIIGGFAESPAQDRVFFRRGQAGAWRDELDARLVQRIEQQHGETMEIMGYQREA
jgi:aryl sulfotransferase